MDFQLPPELRAALDRLTLGLSRHDLAQRAATISDTYRSGGTSKPIASDLDALAYAWVRMPATYAAVAACLSALADAKPDFAPLSLLDIGAGPGTAAWAASRALPSLIDIVLLDANPALRSLALELMADDTRLAEAGYRHIDAQAGLQNSPAADLVTASYVIGELREAERASLADLLWQNTNDTLLVVEPGTPAGYARILELRTRLIAQGAHVLAPCPHDNACPLVAPDWCHFAQRLPRLRDHKLIKGADVPFEDEKFSYCILSRAPVAYRLPRVLAAPHVGKVAVDAKLCTADGVAQISVRHRDKKAYAAARRWRWGDAVSEPT
jgi:ribosomal protein RSM22 (predicted rRNA methylase)